MTAKLVHRREPAMACRAGDGFLAHADKLGRHDSRRHGDEGIPDQHDDRGDRLTGDGLGYDVAITYGRDGHHRPINAYGDADEAVVAAFRDVHRTAEDDDQQEDEGEEHEDLAQAAPDGDAHHPDLFQERYEFQDPEDAKQPEDPNDDEIVVSRDEQAEVGRQDGGQVDQAPEAQDVFPTVVRDIDTEEILDRENTRDDPFEDVEKTGVAGLEPGHALQDHGQDADHDHPEQDDVKCLAGRGIRAEDDHAQFFLEGHGADCRVKFGFILELLLALELSHFPQRHGARFYSISHASSQSEYYTLIAYWRRTLTTGTNTFCW